MKFQPKSSATVIGSFPHEKAADACKLVFDSLSDIPAWPQLPRRDFIEDMYGQFSRSLPCLHIDREKKKVGFDTSKDLPGQLEKFYGRVIADDVEYFGLDDRHAAGFGCFIEEAARRGGEKFLALKGQNAGPITMGLMTDITDGKYALYKPDLFDAIVKNCALNARWQVRALRKLTDTAIVFFDEPSLSIIGSGFYSVDSALISGSLNEIAGEIRKEGGLSGTHCCGNADWDELLGLDLDIINFDATDEIIVDKLINSKNIMQYLEKGKCIAWGIVPTLKEKIEPAALGAVLKNFHSLVKRLAGRGVREDDILNQSIITPSCGTGTLSIALAEKVMSLLSEASVKIKSGN